LANDHYLPWVNVDPVTQQAFISMNSSEEDLTLNIKSRAVRCGFETPGELHPMGSRLFNPTVVDAPYNNFIGDYAGSDAYDGFYAATWTENRTSKNSDGEIFAFVTSLPLSVDPSLNPSGVTRQINGSQFAAGNVFPNPTSGSSVSISIASNEERNATIRIFDLKGNEVLNSIATISPDNTDPLTLDIHALPAGVYHVLISSGTDQVDRNLVILR
ncbi:MAG TPA: T9SS type A sorting domain-containing protein, partial [Candidatus Kapabacteria bacterium]|nr:T9SS type A sorting domain-containing protein [Candidatus Kapabacteria bacterium]